jgi:hypothetical protein
MQDHKSAIKTIVTRLNNYRKIWLIPILLIILALAYKLFISSSSILPFIYSGF